MSSFNHIQAKLHQFIKKYYVNELIKGCILFFSIGLLYVIFTLLIEYFLWLKPIPRTILFILFLIVETALFVFYILIPILKIWGLKKGIDSVKASKLIGNHFPEVSDKLLNMIQLKNNSTTSELIEASINQKSKELKFIPFKKAINFSTNKKYLKYALIPIVIWFLFFITGNGTRFNQSINRVVHYNTQFEPPAPFTFKILNSSLQAIEGESFTLQVETIGNVIPEDAKITFLNETYYLENKGFGEFTFTFPAINDNLNFNLEGGGVVSKVYELKRIKTPVINSFKMLLNYPDYTGKQNEVIQNSGNAIVPQGTMITWQVTTHQTDQVTFRTLNKEPINFDSRIQNNFIYGLQILKPINYSISTSNEQLKNHERLDFGIEVIVDEFPKIHVTSTIDSITTGPAQFFGQLSDDYGIKKLQLIYYDKNKKELIKTALIEVPKTTFTDFYYVFPDRIDIVEGVDYEFYFEVFDNDAINGSKKTVSRKFSYYNKTANELKDALLKEQKDAMSDISKSVEKSKNETTDLERFKKELQKKSDIDWNDTQKLEDYLKRQNQYQELFEKQTNKLEENLKEQKVSENLKEKKEALEKRIEETKEMAAQQKLLDELKKISEKLQKEDLLKKLDDITKNNKQNEKSLERILELTKRFYVEQKLNQIKEKLASLSEEQKSLSNETDENNTSEKQEKINDQFDEIKKDFNELEKQNNDLLRPMKLPNANAEEQEIEDDLDDAFEELSKQDKKDSKSQDKSKAKKNQKTAAKKMQKMSASMEQSMAAMEGESIDENIEDLRKIVENLIEFSFKQEDLMEAFSSSDNNNPEYPSNLKQQYVLKEYFEHIDDSLYVLSLRLTKMGSAIQKEVSDVHFNIDKSLSNFTENDFQKGISNQHFVITSANTLANQLSDLLESLMNASASMGKGKGGEPEFSLPDIIQKQEELTQQMKEGLKKGEAPGKKEGNDNEGNDSNNNGNNGDGENGEEQMNSELYEIYKQQAELRNALNDLMKSGNKVVYNGAGDAMKQMEELEKELLEKGFSKEVIEKMQRLNYELLKLEKANLEQGEDKERTSKSNIEQFKKRNIDSLKLQNQYFNNTEILNRQSLPLRTIYKKKVQEYFNKED